MNKTALITGISGQDGSYLAALLLKAGYTVCGTLRSPSALWRHEYLGIKDRIALHQIDLTDYTKVTSLLTFVQPHEIYHLAAQSSVTESKKDPNPTLHFNVISTLALLEATRKVCPSAKFFHASSSEVFGQTSGEPVTREHRIAPVNPYGTSKASAHLMVKSYRDDSKLFTVNGILFPHESPLRYHGSLIKSVIRQALAIKNGDGSTITLGQIENKRDFGSAEDYARAIWHTLQVDVATDHIIGTGVARSIKDIVYYIADQVGTLRTKIVTSPELSKEPITDIYADTTTTTRELGWTANTSIYATIDAMIEFEQAQKPPTYGT